MNAPFRRPGERASGWGALVRRLVERGPAREVAPPSARSAVRTHVGRVRPINEDRALDRPDRGLWAVADGMGGHAAGDVAAAAVVAALSRLADDPRPIDEAALRQALSRANAEIRAGRADPQRVSGATAVVLHVAEAQATLLWAGDSRAYHCRAGVLTQLTRDHSIVQEMIDAGTLSPARARVHPHAHVVTRALGVSAAVEPEATSIAVQSGDLLLLCSDGLSGGVPAPMIAGRLKRPTDTAADALIAAALAAGGQDNVTVVVVEVG